MTAPLCIDCENYFEQWRYDEYGGRHIEATRCRIKVRSPVHGHDGEPICEWSRRFDDMCGPTGKLWKAKK